MIFAQEMVFAHLGDLFGISFAPDLTAVARSGGLRWTPGAETRGLRGLPQAKRWGKLGLLPGSSVKGREWQETWAHSNTMRPEMSCPHGARRGPAVSVTRTDLLGTCI